MWQSINQIKPIENKQNIFASNNLQNNFLLPKNIKIQHSLPQDILCFSGKNKQSKTSDIKFTPNMTDEQFKQKKEKIQRTFKHLGIPFYQKFLINLQLRKDNIEILPALLNDRENINFIPKILKKTNETTFPIVKALIKENRTNRGTEFDVDFLNKRNEKFARKLFDDGKFDALTICLALSNYNETTETFCAELFADKKFMQSPNVADDFQHIVANVTPANIDFARKIYNNEDFSKNEIGDILGLIEKRKDENYTNFVKELCYDEKFPKNLVPTICAITTKRNLDFAKKLYKKENLPPEYIPKLIGPINKENKKLAEKICDLEYINIDVVPEILHLTNNENIELGKTIISNKVFYLPDAPEILKHTNKQNIELAKQICADKEFPHFNAAKILLTTDRYNISIAKKLCHDRDFPKDAIPRILNNVGEDDVKIAEKIIDTKEISPYDIANILSNIYDKKDRKCINKILQDDNFPKKHLHHISDIVNFKNYDILKELCNNDNIEIPYLRDILKLTTPKNLTFIKQLASDKDFPQICFSYVLEKHGKVRSKTLREIIDYAKDLNKNKGEYGIHDRHIEILLNNHDDISLQQIQKVNKLVGERHRIEPLYIYKFVDLISKNNINELSMYEKKKLLKGLISENITLFEQNDYPKDAFPLLPKNQKEYCTLLPAIVRSLGVETQPCTQEETQKFNQSIFKLSDTLNKFSDIDFVNLEITQTIPQNTFIKNVLEKIQHLPQEERQKVFDYYGFELHANPQNPTGHSLAGYPMNLNNGKKLEQIQHEKTRIAIEALRRNVINFSTNNPIKSNHPEIEKLMNLIVEIMPEIRPQIGRIQFGEHKFDILKHSLKVMQKLSQDINFQNLNESDKKIMLYASLFHDITKRENTPDHSHPENSAFDTSFILKKLHLSKEEEIKLYTLIKNHEWLKYVNTAKDAKELDKRLKNVAYDLRHDNILDLSVMFTHADLKAIKKDDSLHNTRHGKSRKNFKGEVRSFGEAADFYAKKIKKLILELQKTQPLLPVTKFPTASKIKEAITKVNTDGSTNIKGVYQDKDGLVIIKFNEIEDWEKIGFPKGTTTKGIFTTDKDNNKVETGNLKFFVHGLDEATQLAKFDSFSLINSDALLSLSYAERPETKFRFFRAQGVILDVATKNIHGGGDTDSGSGCRKTIQKFKDDYIFGGERQEDRNYISNMIKKATKMNNQSYINFVKQHENQSFVEIENVEQRNKIIKEFATINSNRRKGNREYNEMYGSNPNIMGVFAYEMDYNEKINNPIDFLCRTAIGKHEKNYNRQGFQSVQGRTSFLKEYALQNNLPFVVFGD